MMIDDDTLKQLAGHEPASANRDGRFAGTMLEARLL